MTPKLIKIHKIGAYLFPEESDGQTDRQTRAEANSGL